MSCVPLLGAEVLHCYQWFEAGALAVGVVVEQAKVVEVEVMKVEERLRNSVPDFLVRS